MAEIFRAGIQSVDGARWRPRGVWDFLRESNEKSCSCRPCTMIPAIISQFYHFPKDTSILSVIGFPEPTKAGNIITEILSLPAGLGHHRAHVHGCHRYPPRGLQKLESENECRKIHLKKLSAAIPGAIKRSRRCRRACCLRRAITE